MKRAVLIIIRVAILFILSGFVVYFILGEEQDENLYSFYLHVIVDKGLGFALCVCIGHLYKRWRIDQNYFFK